MIDFIVFGCLFLFDLVIGIYICHTSQHKEESFASMFHGFITGMIFIIFALAFINFIK